LIRQLKPIETGYRQDRRCMDGTRTALLKEITDWVTSGSEQRDALDSNTYWIYGLPGIGKTSLAHSICASLHDHKQLAGAFFCRRDDWNLSEPRNILPTLIHQLAIVLPPFRRIVAEHLREDPYVTPETMKHALFLDFIRKLPRLPGRTLVFVIDALDECGSIQSRPDILNTLTSAAAHTPWLKVIITSRPEVDIQRFFHDSTQLSHLKYDLTTDEATTSDLRLFAEDRFKRVALIRPLQSPWPEQSLFDSVISRAAGLFIFIETLALALEHCDDAIELLNTTLQDSASAGLTSLYELYSSIVRARKVQQNAEFRRMIGVLIKNAPYRPLCEETIAELAGVRPDLVKTWVEDLGSMLYRDGEASGGIRVRHLSIADFFVSDDCFPAHTSADPLRNIDEGSIRQSILIASVANSEPIDVETLPGVDESQPSPQRPPSPLAPQSTPLSSHLSILARGDDPTPSTSEDETPSDPHSPSPSFITLTEVSPDHGPLSGGEKILAVGSGFGAEQHLRIRFGHHQTPTQTTFVAPNILKCILPPYHTEGPVIVTLHLPSQPESVLNEHESIFTYKDRSKWDM